jgi:uncharacterized protein (DUF305 family)
MRRVAALVVTMTTAVAACRTASAPGAAIVQPGAPGEETRVITAAAASDLSRVQHSPADVLFMQGMIHHHAQALQMVDLLRTRTAARDMQAMAQRIELSQRDEIAFMRQWLMSRGEEAPDEHAHHLGPVPMMPGMLSPEEMQQLADSTGTAFDRLFLNAMIKHHLGAIAMVDDLLSTAGAAQQTEVFAFTSDVVADQRAEIERMGALLASIEAAR